MATILVGQTKTISLNTLDPFTQFAPLSDIPVWTNSGGTLTVALDGLSATFSSASMGTFVIDVTCMGCGANNEDLSASLTIEVVSAFATSLTLDTDPGGGSTNLVLHGVSGNPDSESLDLLATPDVGGFEFPVVWSLSNPNALLLTFDPLDLDNSNPTCKSNMIGSVVVTATSGSLSDTIEVNIYKDFASSMTLTLS